jgi:hypothetical protein
MVRKINLFLILSFFFLVSLSFTSAWIVNGTVYDTTGIPLNNTNVSVTAGFFPGGTSPTYFGVNSTTTNAAGYFIMSVEDNSSRQYNIALLHRNATTDAVDYVGQTLPYFPYQEVSRNISTNFYLKSAGTFNITAINSTGDRINFNYQIKDTQLGFTILSAFTSQGVSSATINVPSDRNYSIMIYPSQSMPVSYNWNNFTATQDYTFSDTLSRYNVSTKTLSKQFNTSMNLIRVTGYLNATGISNWNSIVVIPYLLQPGNMIMMSDSGYGSMPNNMSAWNCPLGVCQTDSYSTTSGFYNITLPGPAEPQTILIYISAKNNSNYYGGYKNVSVSYSSAESQYNTSMYGLLGSTLANLTMQLSQGQGTFKTPTNKQTFNLVNLSDNSSITLSLEAHVKISLDYSSTACGIVQPFSLMVDSASGSTSFAVPLLNCTGIKEMNIFTQNFAPRRIPSQTVSQITANNNVSLGNFNPRALDGTSGSSISMAMLISNSTCNIPEPGVGCYVGGSGINMSSFNPLSAVIGGGKISFRMGMGNVTVHYVNVDMLASGPPDALFDNNNAVSATSSGGVFGKIMRFGSQGPTIYDYILVSMPYSSGSGGLNDSAQVNLSIPVFYDENWNVAWNVSVNGSSADALAGNDSHYSTYKNAWANLTVSKACTRGTISTSAEINETNPCYINNVTDIIWVRLPHFSGTGPQVSGTVVPTTTTTTDNTGGSGGSGSTISFWYVTYFPTAVQLSTGFTQDLINHALVKVAVGNETHQVGIVDLDKNSSKITINVSSETQQATLAVGEEKKFDVNADNYYDISVLLNSITGNFAKVTIKTINEQVIVPSEDKTPLDSVKDAVNTAKEEVKTNTLLKWIIIALVVIIILVLVYVIIRKSKKY